MFNEEERQELMDVIRKGRSYEHRKKPTRRNIFYIPEAKNNV